MNDHETVSLASPRLEHFIEQARQYPPLKTAVVDTGEVHVLEGLLQAKAEGLVDPILIGRPERIQQLCGTLACPPPGERELIPADSDAEAAAIGVNLVQQGKADALAKDLEYLAGATLAGIVAGTTVPIMLPPRSDPPLARLAAALAVIIHNRTAQPAAGSPS